MLHVLLAGKNRKNQDQKEFTLDSSISLALRLPFYILHLLQEGLPGPELGNHCYLLDFEPWSATPGM